MIGFAGFLIVIAIFFFLFSIMTERPWLRWWMIPFLLLAGAIIWGKIVGVI